MKKINLLQTLILCFVTSIFLQSCGDDDSTTPTLEIPTTYVSADYNTNVTAENTVRTELATLTTAMNDAESDAGMSTVAAITYPSTLRSVTLSSYATKTDSWLVELVKAANNGTFTNPGMGGTPSGDGGLLGSRLLDENGLELEQMVQKGAFGAALYNHALTVINNNDLTSATTDKLIEIFGTDITFDITEVTNAATYARRRSDLDNQTGLFYDMRDNLLTAKAAIEGGSAFNTIRDQALTDFKLNWEKSNFATVIFYCNAAKNQLTAAGSDATLQGNALHAYAEGVAFAAGWKGLADKQISDTKIDEILTKLLATDGATPTSFEFLNNAMLLDNLDDVIDIIQTEYGFTDTEVSSFFVNNNP